MYVCMYVCMYVYLFCRQTHCLNWMVVLVLFCCTRATCRVSCSQSCD
jgi:hypothetical protein